MNDYHPLSVAVLAAGCLMLSVGVQAAQDAKRIFQPLYDQMDKAAANKDVNASIYFYSPDYICFKQDGEKYSFDYMREGTTKVFAKYRVIQPKTIVQSATVEKGGATTVTKTHITYIRNTDVSGQEVVINVDATDRDYWVKSQDGWKLKQERHLSSHQTRSVRPTVNL